MSRIIFKAQPSVTAHEAFADRRLAPEDIRELLNARKSLQKLFASDERYADAAVESAYVSIALMGGEKLPLITLLELWAHDEPGWTVECRECGGRALIFGYGGSPLSGSGSGWGICPSCGRSVKVPFSMRAAGRALELAWTFRQSTEKGRRLAGETAVTPVKHAEEGSEKVLTVFDVLDRLHAQAAGKGKVHQDSHYNRT